MSLVNYKMPLKKMGSKDACISHNYKEMIASGREKKVARAAALNFCSKYYGGISKKKSKHEKLMYDIMFELIDLDMIDVKLAKVKKYMQKASRKITKKK